MFRRRWNNPLKCCDIIAKPFSLQIALKHSGGRGGSRPEKKVYHRVPDLDRVMDLQKKPAAMLQLRDIIVSSKNQSVLLRDLEKEVGFFQKWNFLALIEKQPAIFRVNGGGGTRAPISVRLTERAAKLSALEEKARGEMEPILVKNLRKLLMMSIDCQVPLEKVELIASDLGLPVDYETSIIIKYPQFFSIRTLNKTDYLCLESWDSSLAVTAREEKYALEPGETAKPSRGEISRDGNYCGPFAFRLNFPAGFRPNTNFLKEVLKWQKLAFPSPYLNARRVDPATPQARKRAVAVLHEILSLTMEKRLTSDKLDAFHNEYQLPCKLLLCLIKNHGIFYITNKGARSTVLLKEAYDGCYLKEKCPLLRFQDQFVSLCGRPPSDPKTVNAAVMDLGY